MYFKILFLLVLLVLLLIIFIHIQNKINYLFYIIIIFIIFYLLFNNSYKLYNYNKFINNNDYREYNDNKKYKDYIEYKNYNNLDTCDIIQEYIPWNFNFFYYILNIKFLHNFIILNFNNKKYIIHLVTKYDYPKYVLNIKSKYLNISTLNSYLKNNSHITRYYRLFKFKNKLDNNRIFNCLKYITKKDISFSYLNIFNTFDNKYQCMSFILKIIYYLNIIPKFNFNIFLPDDLYYLPNLSNGLYDYPIILKYN